MPRNHDRVTAESPLRHEGETRAHELLLGLARRRSFFTAAFLERVLQVSDYDVGMVSPEELRERCETSFDVLTACLVAGPGGIEEARRQLVVAATDLTRARAAQGVRPENLAAAIRLDYSVLWEQLRGLARPGDAEVLVDLAEPLWQVVDDYASAVHAAYLDLREQQARRESEVQQELITELFSGPTSVYRAADIAGLLGWSPAEHLTVATSPRADHELIKQTVARHSHTGQTHLVILDAHTTAVFPATDTALSSALRAIPCGIVEGIDGAENLWRHRSRVLSLADLITPEDDHALTVDTAWARVAARANASEGYDLGRAIDEGLARGHGAEAERLRVTVGHYLATGSVARTAELAFCHRNTVLNHLRRFEELTGIDVTVPAQAAKVVVGWA